MNIKQVLRLTAGILLALIVLAGCNERNDLGLEVLPEGDLITVKETTVKDDISAFTHREEQLISSGGTSLLGSFNDPVFGDTDIEFAAQYRLLSYPGFALGTGTVVDSVRLYLRYSAVYGDTITPQKFSVYELSESLDPDVDYTQDIDLKSMSYDQLLGEVSHIPKVPKVDTLPNRIDTTFNPIIIPIDNSLGEKLIGLDSTILSNNDSLLQVFKGLFVETEEITSSVGSILTLDPNRSGLVLYYNTEENMAKEEPDTLFTTINITDNSARVMSIDHDYSGTPFEPNLDQYTLEDENIYVQPTGGLKAFISIEDLGSWRDSVNTTVNKAELVFQMDTIASDIENYPPPSQLLITFIDDEEEEKLPKDYYFDPVIYGGFLYEGYEYRFNITQHLQSIIDGEVGNNGFYLSTGRRNNYANRVIIEGARKPTGIKLHITYSKFLQ